MLKLKGSIKISGDKSISHRALILSAMSSGKSKISNLLESKDIMNTIHILRQLGIKIKKKDSFWIVFGNGTNGFIEPKTYLDCGNSGTTARLMLGAVASNPINCTFIGDSSLSKRSMSRVTQHLEKIGSDIKLTKKDFLPVMISGNENLLPVDHTMTKASAQIKSALILAGLNIHGKTRIIENRPTRDHTERLLEYLKVKFVKRIRKNGITKIELNGPYEIQPRNIQVASDPSSAAFFVVGALITPFSKITLKNICLNPTRIAYIKILKKMGGKIKIKKTKTICGESIGDIRVETSKLKAIQIDSSLAPSLIDEYPILAIAATQARGKTIMRGLSELRHKESDRIRSIVVNLKKLGHKIDTKKDDIIITGKKIDLNKTYKIKTYKDHRIAMSFLILNLISNNKIKVDDENCIKISYPYFKKHLNQLVQNT